MPHNDLHDDEVDSRAAPPTADEVDTAREVIETLLGKMGMDASVHVEAGEDAVMASLDGEDAGRLIGRQGQTLDALQYVVNRMVRQPVPHAPVYLDVAGYRERRREMLEAMAHKLAQKAITEHRPVTVEPMSARDRRTMHLALSKVSGVTTRSRGEGEDRQLQIFPVSAKK